jgi:hypothetical protein
MKENKTKTISVVVTNSQHKLMTSCKHNQNWFQILMIGCNANQKAWEEHQKWLKSKEMRRTGTFTDASGHKKERGDTMLKKTKCIHCKKIGLLFYGQCMYCHKVVIPLEDVVTP